MILWILLVRLTATGMTRVAKQKSKRTALRPAEGGRREANKEDKRERIREAAFELFLEHGVGGTKLADVAERAGVAKGTLFLYASDKEDLVCMVMHERLAVAVERAFRTLPRGVPLLDELVHVFGLLLRTYGEAPDLASAFVRALGTASGPNGRRMAALTYSFLHQLGGLVHAAKARGEVAQDIDVLAAAQNLFALYFAAIISWLGGYGTLEDAIEKQLRTSLALQLRGLAH
jgi:AcrR family transcriptional regulator